MRIFMFRFLTVAFLLAPVAVLGAEESVREPVSKSARLDSYFSQLKRIRDPAAASDVTAKIWGEWNDSGSATVNLLLEWARDAMHSRRYPAALDFLDRATTIAPNYAEGWNKRATLHYHMGNYKKSMSDITRVLALEPRHFGALAGMASILEETGEDEQALDVWRRLLEFYPADRQAQDRVVELSEKIAGNQI